MCIKRQTIFKKIYVNNKKIRYKNGFFSNLVKPEVNSLVTF